MFLTGYPKSGTTLLLALLDGHSALNVFPKETLFFDVARDELVADPASGLERFVERIFSGALFGLDRAPDSAVAPDLYRAELGKAWAAVDHDPSRFLDLAVETFGRLAGTAGRPFWVEKAPHAELHVPTLSRWYPDARVIHLFRDPRANYAAFQAWADRVGDPSGFARFASHWRSSLRAAERNRTLLPQLELRYEDLVEETSDCMEQVCRFLGIEMEPVLLEPTLEGVPFRGNSMFDATFDGVSARSLDRWREVLPESQTRLLEWTLKGEMTTLGYAFGEAGTPSRPPPGAGAISGALLLYSIYDRLPARLHRFFRSARAWLTGRVPRRL